MTTGICKGETAWLQKSLTVQAKGRGCHLITDQILAAVPELRKFLIGTFSVFIQHTSASLSINENADPTGTPRCFLAIFFLPFKRPDYILSFIPRSSHGHGESLKYASPRVLGYRWLARPCVSAKEGKWILSRNCKKTYYLVFARRDEGPDDITGHVKSTIVGANLTIPVSNGRLALVRPRASLCVQAVWERDFWGACSGNPE